MPFFLTKFAKSSHSLPRFPFKKRKNVDATAFQEAAPAPVVPQTPGEPPPPFKATQATPASQSCLADKYSTPSGTAGETPSHVPDWVPSTGTATSKATSKAWHSTMLDSLSKTMSRSGLKMAAAASNTLSSTSSLGSASILGGHASSSTASHRSLSANVVFLDGTAQIFEVDKRAKGQVLLDLVHAHLEPIERQYFGLLFNDSGAVIMPQGHAPDVMRWLDPEKPIRKQMRALGGGSRLNGGLATPILYFRVKFYATDPTRFIEDNTREHMYLQVKRDLQECRLTAPISSLCMLASYSAQAKCGDFDDHDASRKEGLMEFLNLRDSNNQPRLSHTHSLDLNEIHHKVTELHKLHRGQTRADAISRFLKYATRLDMYGIAIHHGKDSSGKDIQLGVTSMGLVVFQNQVKINTFSWSKIVKISFKRKQFFIQLKRELSEDYDTLLGFNLASYRSCKNLWKSAVEHHAFFRLSSANYSPKQPKRAIFPSLSARFRQSGRSRTGLQPPEPSAPASFSRTLPARKTLPLSLEIANRRDGSMPRLASPETSSIGSSVHSHGGKLKPSAPALVSLKRGSVDANSMTASSSSLAHRAFESLNNKVQSFSTKLPKKAWEEETDGVDRPDRAALHSDDEGGFLDPARRISSLGRLSTSSSSTVPKSGSNHVGDTPHGFGTGPARPGIETGFSIPATSTPIKGHHPPTGLAREAREARGPPSSLPFGINRFPFADESSVSGQSSASHQTALSASPSVGAVKSAANGHALIAQRALGGGITPAGSGALQLSQHPLTKEDASSCSTSSTISISNGGQPGSLNPTQVRSISTHASAPFCSPRLSHGGCASGGEEDSGEGLVQIIIRPDEDGRFGFNVKGGADQKTPIIVSKVGCNTQADKCFPKLNEGDQVVFINGREVSGHTHEQVVNFIRASREPHSGELILAVKQNVYMGEEVEEPEFQYVPERTSEGSMGGGNGPSQHGTRASSDLGVSERVPEGAHKALSQSMLLLAESTESNAVFGQFEQLSRKNPSLAMSLCHAPSNLDKNRYRDISPYDVTRVLLKQCPSGDYINANHVDMTIPGSGIINRYIATQGPLSTTSADFWYMTWEAQSTLIIMLTTIVERGRVKCHKYWPDMGETLRFPGGLEVKCTRDTQQGSFAFRDFQLCMTKPKKSAASKKHRLARKKQKTKAKKNSPSSSTTSSSHSTSSSSSSPSCSTASNSEGEESSGDDLEEEVRQVSQMAYLSWPDHGVPESPDEFIHFVEQVRTHRQGCFEPTIVHCSAGIGRTGVLILMETAMCLIEANQAVYPLDLTRQMRDQRASMVQTGIQYKFVCEAILQVYKSGLVKPLPEFCQPLVPNSANSKPPIS
ncbi:hypothetical protein TCAL_07031 [Tigriopus californicus]|uniref:protein-tyrosine-phosphatase n=1 Tax=Tigriopus californicus TaxID=6832 RepID=A0A553PAN0_TIGCA|nr:hypothetical protein TCAL_07031 [Tigriopus californicus]|eukprot:TCALIF_07031-PA protein Name:"Similar to PTPN3 Tyrosine-protein phosphatase non-receptor type 3 (Homo sapiens)" AED:0.02 eAED:0.07 QI:65/0.83/0.85/1/0.66/0.71/7/511/1354